MADTTKKIIRGVVNSRGFTITSPITQWDYGWQFIPEIDDLPPTYRLDFSNEEKRGTALPVYCSTDGAEVPTELIDTGKDVWVWFVRIGDGFGITEYKWRVPNKCKSKTEEDEPTPTQQGIVDQAIAQLNAAVEKTTQDVLTTTMNAAEAQRYAEDADQSAQDAEDSKTAAETAKNAAETARANAQTSEANAALSENAAEQAKQTAQRSAEDAAAAKEESVTASETADRAADRAVAASLAAADSEANAAEHERQAGTQAGAARSAADTAADKATQAAQSASDASTQNTAAQTAKTAAETARTAAESARDAAAAAETSAQQSESAMRELLEEYSDVATEATAQEILRREEDGLALMEFALRALDNRLDMMVEDLPHDTTGQQLAEALNFGNSMLNALYNELANEEV